jgi:nitroreductase
VSSLFDVAVARRSYSKVTDNAPSTEELLTLIAGAGRVADHGSLQPWRLIELRGSARDRLGKALASAAGNKNGFSSKPLRAPLLIAIVVRYKKGTSIPRWEQQAVASGVAHTLSLLLYDAGWGVIWRTGKYTRAKSVAKMHNLSKNEELLGWLYVGGIPHRDRPSRRKNIDPSMFLTAVPE